MSFYKSLNKDEAMTMPDCYSISVFFYIIHIASFYISFIKCVNYIIYF